MRQVELGSTGLSCSALGFGCAGIFSLPSRRERQEVLEIALEAGFRHFDVAPIYGLGRAEAELGALLRRHPDGVTVATKFGIELTPAGLVLGRVQGPIRSVLRARPGLREGLRRSGRGPRAGMAGRLLYTAPGWSPRAAERSLEASLRAMGLARVDLLLLHDPNAVPPSAVPALVAFLGRQGELGRIGTWGVTGARRAMPGVPRELVEAAPVLQFQDDQLEVGEPEPDREGRGWVTFGVLGSALMALGRALAAQPERVYGLGERLGADLRQPGALADLVLRRAMRRNPLGPVLFSSSRPDRVRAAAESVGRSPLAPAGEGDQAAWRELVQLAASAPP